jgi:hypothetical protein
MPNKGVVVRDFSPKDVHDIYEIRALLESAAAKDAAGKIAKASLETIIAKASVLGPTAGSWPACFRAVKKGIEISCARTSAGRASMSESSSKASHSMRAN